MSVDPPAAGSSATPWLEDRYLDALTLYREITDAGSNGYPRRRLQAGERWAEALELLLLAEVVIEVPAPRSRGSSPPDTVLRSAHAVGAPGTPSAPS